MKIRVILLAVLLLLSGATDASAQRRRGKGDSGDVQTPENAVERQKADLAEKEAEYKAKREHQKKLQDKATRKRMKQNLKRSRKQSWGKEIPWYKRLFRRRKF